MERTKLLELALQALQQQRAEIETEIKALKAELAGTGESVREMPLTPAAAARRPRQRTAAQKAAQARKMREIWAARKAKESVVVADTKPASAPAASKRRAKTAAEKKSLSLKMKEAWKKRKAKTPKTE